MFWKRRWCGCRVFYCALWSGAFVYELFFLKNIGNAYDASDELPPLWRGRNNCLYFRSGGIYFFHYCLGALVCRVSSSVYNLAHWGNIICFSIWHLPCADGASLCELSLIHTSLKILKGTLFAHSIFLVPGMAAFFFTVGYLGALDDSKDVTKKATVYLIGSSLHSEKKSLDFAETLTNLLLLLMNVRVKFL